MPTTKEITKLYLPNNGSTVLAQKLYGPVKKLTTLSGTIRSGGAGNLTGFNGAEMIAEMQSRAPALLFADGEYGELDYIQVVLSPTTPYTYSLRFYYKFTHGYAYRTNGYGMGLPNWGVYGLPAADGTLGSDYIDVTTTYTPYAAQAVKIYGPTGS